MIKIFQKGIFITTPTTIDETRFVIGNDNVWRGVFNFIFYQQLIGTSRQTIECSHCYEYGIFFCKYFNQAPSLRQMFPKSESVD